MKISNRVTTLAAAALVAALPAAGSAQTWTTWSSSTPATWDGTLLGTAVSFVGAYAAGSQFSNNGSDFFAPNGAYTQGGLIAPDAGGNNGFVQIIEPTSATITFSSAMTDLYLAFISVGQGNDPVTYTFDHPFTVLSNNNTSCAHFGCGSYTTSGNSITGVEFSGTIQFIGTFDELTLTTDPREDWHGITVGADAVAPPVLGTPEPATFALFGTGLFGLAGARRIRRKRAA